VVDNKGLKKFAKLYEKYSNEELLHADFSKDFLLAYGITPTLQKLEAPEASFECLTDIIDLTLEHEQEITRQCNELNIFACETKLGTLQTLALKYLSEQIEELDKAQNLCDMSKLTTDLMIFDNYVGENLLD
jgi:ferritin